MRYLFKPEARYTSALQMERVFVDPAIAMVCIGALGHQLGNHFMMSLGYWQMWLACMVLQALWPIDRPGNYTITRDGDA